MLSKVMDFLPTKIFDFDRAKQGHAISSIISQRKQSWAQSARHLEEQSNQNALIKKHNLRRLFNHIFLSSQLFYKYQWYFEKML